MSLKARISEDMKAAMKAKESAKLSAIRLLLAAIKQKEVDERIELDDTAVLGMHRHLGVQGMRQQTGFAVVERNAGFVAGRFNTKDQHDSDFNTWS